MNILKKIIWCGFTIFVMTYSHAKGYLPENGFVPNQATAIKIAEAVLVPIYGQKTIDGEKPFRVSLDDQIWVVKGKELPPDMLGGTFII